MLEFSSVTPMDYIDPVTDESVTLRLLHRTDDGTSLKMIKVEGKDIDLICREQTGGYEDILKIVEHNSQLLSEHLYQLESLEEISIPK